ncbi:hypothetical protein JAAARDRAFT_189351 [Jaapia argillacea MUCL 33604]|uniref:Uncharacterized protein n=1 Tax=Jaapia argillacea MUCL 33604 TaxID=933084 RepID=A0A067QA15_9AGAM|nr:hypothetical protein JAAARDRAFT_189351 [Jaapia argillacea MUCL 33604]
MSPYDRVCLAGLDAMVLHLQHNHSSQHSSVQPTEQPIASSKASSNRSNRSASRSPLRDKSTHLNANDTVFVASSKSPASPTPPVSVSPVRKPSKSKSTSTRPKPRPKPLPISPTVLSKPLPLIPISSTPSSPAPTLPPKSLYERTPSRSSSTSSIPFPTVERPLPPIPISPAPSQIAYAETDPLSPPTPPCLPSPSRTRTPTPSPTHNRVPNSLRDASPSLHGDVPNHSHTPAHAIPAHHNDPCAFPSLEHPNSPYVPWAPPLRRRIIRPPSPLPHQLRESPSAHHLVREDSYSIVSISSSWRRSGARAPEPPESEFDDFDFEDEDISGCMRLKVGLGKKGRMMRKSMSNIGNSFKRNVTIISKRLLRQPSHIFLHRHADSEESLPNSPNPVIVVFSPHSPTPSASAHSLRAASPSPSEPLSFASSAGSTTLVEWLAERRRMELEDDVRGMSLEEYEDRGSWLQLELGLNVEDADGMGWGEEVTSWFETYEHGQDRRIEDDHAEIEQREGHEDVYEDVGSITATEMEYPQSINYTFSLTPPSSPPLGPISPGLHNVPELDSVLEEEMYRKGPPPDGEEHGLADETLVEPEPELPANPAFSPTLSRSLSLPSPPRNRVSLCLSISINPPHDAPLLEEFGSPALPEKYISGRGVGVGRRVRKIKSECGIEFEEERKRRLLREVVCFKGKLYFPEGQGGW